MRIKKKSILSILWALSMGVLVGAMVVGVAWGQGPQLRQVPLTPTQRGATVMEGSQGEEGRLISPELREGEHLIYHCQKKFWACVDSEAFEKCKESRMKALAKREAYHLPCAPLKKHSSLAECVVKQRREVELSRSPSFCYRKKKKRFY